MASGEDKRSKRTPKRRQVPSPRPCADLIQPIKLDGIFERAAQPTPRDDEEDEPTNNIWLVAVTRPSSSETPEELAFLFAPTHLPPATDPPETHSILVCLEAAPGSADGPIEWFPVEHEVSQDLEQDPTVGDIQLLAAVRVGRERPGQSLERNEEGQVELTLTVQDLCCDDYYVVDADAPPPWIEWVHAVLDDLWSNSGAAAIPPQSAASQIIAGVRSLATTNTTNAATGVHWSLDATACDYLLISYSADGDYRGWPLSSGSPALEQ